MNFQHLKYITEVEKTKSITKAAQNLFMGQPNLSKAIKELEQEIGITLFRRTAKGVEPTHKGLEFLAYAKTIISQMDELTSLYQPDVSDIYEINLSVPRATYIASAFTTFLNSLTSEDKIHINFKETNSNNSVNEVYNDESDLGIIRYPEMGENYFLSLLKDKNLDYEFLWEFHMGVLMSKRHPLADFQEIPFHQLNDYIEIVHGDYQEPNLSFSNIKRAASLEVPNKKIFIYERGSQFDLLKDVPQTYMWVSPIPQKFLQDNNLVLRPCSVSGICNKDILIYQKDHQFTKYETLFIQTVKEQISRM